MKAFFKKLYKVFSQAEKYFLFAIFFFATVFVVINVLGRKLLGFSFNWLEELNRYVLVICTFVGGGIAVSKGSHASMDSVVGLFKGRARPIVEAFASLIYALFLFVMVYYAFKQLGTMIKLSAMTATLGLPVYVFFAFIPLGLTGIAVRTAVRCGLRVAEAVQYKKPGDPSLPEKGSEKA